MAYGDLLRRAKNYDEFKALVDQNNSFGIGEDPNSIYKKAGGGVKGASAAVSSGLLSGLRKVNDIATAPTKAALNAVGQVAPGVYSGLTGDVGDAQQNQTSAAAIGAAPSIAEPAQTKAFYQPATGSQLTQQVSQQQAPSQSNVAKLTGGSVNTVPSSTFTGGPVFSDPGVREALNAAAARGDFDLIRDAYQKGGGTFRGETAEDTQIRELGQRLNAARGAEREGLLKQYNALTANRDSQGAKELARLSTLADIGYKQAQISGLANKNQFGQAPSGFRFKQDGTLEPIPGGPSDQLSSDQKKTLSDINITRSTAQRLLESFKPEYVGIAGSVGEVSDKYGTQLPLIGNLAGNPDRVRFRQDASTLVNNYINQITGATVGQGQETARLMRAVPNPSDSPLQFEAKLKEMLKNLDELPNIIANNPNISKIGQQQITSPQQAQNSGQRMVNVNGNQLQAKQAPDGKFYVEQNGRYFEVEG